MRVHIHSDRTHPKGTGTVRSFPDRCQLEDAHVTACSCFFIDTHELCIHNTLERFAIEAAQWQAEPWEGLGGVGRGGQGSGLALTGKGLSGSVRHSYLAVHP